MRRGMGCRVDSVLCFRRQRQNLGVMYAMVEVAFEHLNRTDIHIKWASCSFDVDSLFSLRKASKPRLSEVLPRWPWSGMVPGQRTVVPASMMAVGLSRQDLR